MGAQMKTEAVLAAAGVTYEWRYRKPFQGEQFSRESQFAYEVNLRSTRGAALFRYSMGIGHAKSYRFPMTREVESRVEQEWRTSPPRPNELDVLQCLFMDARALDLTHEEWCREYGCNEDSRTDYALWETCRKNGRDLRRVLGEHYEEVRAATEEDDQ